MRRGDLVKLDVTAQLDGFYATPASRSRSAGPRATLALMAAGRAALTRALGATRAGTPINHMGGTIEDTVRTRGYAVCRDLMGHGIGRRIHEWPDVPNFDARWAGQRLTEGLVITIEPIVSAGTEAVRLTGDGWTIATADGARCAHSEHTIVITRDQPPILTR